MYMIEIDLEKCQGCGDCIENCPNEIFSLVEEDGKKHAIVSGDPDECIGCLSCEAECEEGAVTVTEL
jgi:NAD-dependent dihydropyrimidine dehydrogenase PreA subunit